MGPDVERYLQAIDAYERAGYDHVTLHQVGSDQESFFAFATRFLFPKLQAA